MNILLTLLIFYIFRLYHSLWAFAGETELQNLVVSCAISALLNSVGLQFFKVSEQPVPKSYYFLYMFVLISMMFVSRFSYRFLRSQKHKQFDNIIFTNPALRKSTISPIFRRSC